MTVFETIHYSEFLVNPKLGCLELRMQRVLLVRSYFAHLYFKNYKKRERGEV